jgi:uncharacterized protein YggE
MALAIGGGERPNRPLPQMSQELQIDGAHGIGFGHNDPTALLDKARPLAVAHARRKAGIDASAEGARIGRLMALTEEAGRQMPIAFSRAYTRRPRADTDRGGRGQPDPDRHRAV